MKYKLLHLMAHVEDSTVPTVLDSKPIVHLKTKIIMYVVWSTRDGSVEGEERERATLLTEQEFKERKKEYLLAFSTEGTFV